LSKPSAAPAYPSVAILTVNTNGEAFMAEFADSLASVGYPNYRLVVVDNASTDDSLQILSRSHPQAVVLRNDTNLGFTGACNRGLEYCLSRSFDYVLVLNSDVLMESDFLDRLVAAADERTMTAPKSYLYHHPGRLDDSVGEFDWVRGVWMRPILGKEPTPDFDQPRLVDSANLSCLLVPSGLLRDVGLLDDSFFIYYDDTDFVRRARDRSYRLWFVPSAVIHHRKGATIGGPETAFGLYYLTRNRPYLIQKHVRSPARLALFWVYFVTSRLIRVVIKLSRGRGDLAKAILLGLVDYWRGRMGKTVERDDRSSGMQRNGPGFELPERPVPGT
jgi:GT2 family glycosyltransferase